MIVKENTTPTHLVLYNKKKLLLKKKKIMLWPNVAVTGKCLYKYLIIYVNVPNNSSPRTQPSAQEWQNISLLEQKSQKDISFFPVEKTKK